MPFSPGVGTGGVTAGDSGGVGTGEMAAGVFAGAADGCEGRHAGRFIVHADQELPAFLELESAIQTDLHNHECDCPDEELGSNRR